jgi:hypothetical protein
MTGGPAGIVVLGQSRGRSNAAQRERGALRMAPRAGVGNPTGGSFAWSADWPFAGPRGEDPKVGRVRIKAILPGFGKGSDGNKCVGEGRGGWWGVLR